MPGYGADDMTALLVMVHGSPRPESNEDMFRVVEEIRTRGSHGMVAVGFLDCNEPDIATAIAECVERGAREIVAVPYFLHSGRHVTRDLPDLLEAAMEDHPGVVIRMGPFIGSRPEIADVVRDRVAEVTID